jgi:polyhydroxyalkanoate synthesis regulator phasin
VRDALKNYLSLAGGLSEVGRQRAVAASKALVAQGEATAEQVSSLAEDLMKTSKNNRELVTALVRSEIDKALGRVGLATADEVQRLTRRLQALEGTLRDATGRATRGDARPGTAKPSAKAAAKPTTRKATPKPAAKPAARKPAVKPARKPAATAPAKKAAKKTAKPAKKTATKARS